MSTCRLHALVFGQVLASLRRTGGRRPGAYRAAGAKLREFYLVTRGGRRRGAGRRDSGQLSLAIGARGNVRIETCRAFPEEECRRIVAGLPAVK